MVGLPTQGRVQCIRTIREIGENMRRLNQNTNKVFKRSKLMLILADQHIPFEHKDSLPFLLHIKKKYEKLYGIKADVLSIGDLTDEPFRHGHHPHSHFLGDKESIFNRTVKTLKKYIKAFPKMIIVEGNHDIGSQNTAISDNRDLRDIKQPQEKYSIIPDTWNYVPYAIVNNVFYVHGIKKAQGRNSSLAMAKGMSSVQGHYHTLAEAYHFMLKNGKKVFNAFTGCSINTEDPAFEYGDNMSMCGDIKLSCLVVYGDDTCHLEPMRLKSNGRWNRGK